MPAIELPEGYRWEQRIVPDHVWQAHLLKHPLGLRALRWKPARPWNQEGWDRLDPPGITAEQRAAFVSEIGKLSLLGRSCGIGELRGQPAGAGDPECYGCKPPLLEACRDRLATTGLPARYLQETESIVRRVVDAVPVPRAKLTYRTIAALRDPTSLNDLAVMSVGRDADGTALARISTAEGERVELYLEPPSRLLWRTTFRDPQAQVNGRQKFLTMGVPEDPKLPMSEVFFVARDWVNRHGI